MTVEQAQEVKGLLMQIRDNIPASLVNPIWDAYSKYVSPGESKPCTCKPANWQRIVDMLKQKVESTLNAA